jgi:type IV pilus assembly protein PilA
MIMKKTNKGFSMVELIIVIAIMAILAGALAPALIKYINKSRLSTDISTAQTIATSIQTAFSNEDAYSAATNQTTAKVDVLFSATDSFASEFKDAMNMNTAPAMKSKKDLGNVAFPTGAAFSVKFSADGSSLSVWIGSADDNHLAYPTTGASVAK